MTAADNQPDWDAIAEKFDLWLPAIAPVGEKLLAVLDVQSGMQILDVASGTGEPALTLARRFAGEVNIRGIDSAEGMIKVGQKKVLAEKLKNITFQTMFSEQMSFADDRFDRILCRFGVMLFEDPQQGLKEMCRVLKPGGKTAMAVWSTPETMPTMYWAYEAFRSLIPEEAYPPLMKVTSLGAVGVLDGMLTQAGFAEYDIESHTFHYQFESFEQYWDLVEASDILKMQYDLLSPEQRDLVRDEVGRFAKDFVTDQGLVIPHDYLLATAVKR